jgi:uncharacterized membrane protein
MRWDTCRKMKIFEHKPHPYQTQNLNAVHDNSLSIGQRVSDAFASIMGSWRFIIIQSIILVIWIVINTVAFFVHWDNYPYVLLNLALSFQAAFATPIILMSQNRQASKDRLMAEHDYQINLKNEEETRQLIQHLYEQDSELLKQTTMLITLLQHAKGVYHES